MRHILVADHDDEIFQAACQALRFNYTISPLPENSDLQPYFQTNTADMIILTVSETDTSNMKTYEILSKIPEIIGVPVIFFAKHSDLELEQNIIIMGAEEYITLPISPELLLHRVCSCLELCGLRKERPILEKYQDAISQTFAELVECRDVSTGGHLKNTTRYFTILLQEVMKHDSYKERIPYEDTKDLVRSVMLHDVGKIGINDDVLRKESTLNRNEFEHMKTHTTLGKQAFEHVIKKTGGARWLVLASDMAYCHHERWDGAGYPNGLKGEEIPLYARMLTIVDVYDALTSNRAYKEAYSHESAVEIILEGKGTKFDPDLVDVFISINDQFEEALNNISYEKFDF
jgi:putative two-component system response regulator